jgi:lipopolysaccharide/colanic/teichoic acid biosynthesis glycosyltransferase
MIPYNPYIKRFLDIILSLFAMAFFIPLFAITYILIRSESEGSPFFIQERIGRGMKPFRLIKFRSMRIKTVSGNQFEPGHICRITRFGKILRKTKIDELPELINIFKGDMSIVGPRPEVSQYVQIYPYDFREILKVRPGLSDYASIKYRNEEEILAYQSDPDEYYRRVILPDKLNLAKYYIKNISFQTDRHIIITTIRSIFKR